MKNKISIIGLALLLASSLITRAQQVTAPTPALAFPKPPPSNIFTNPSPDGFKPLTRLRTQTDAKRNTIYVVGQPKGQWLDGGMTPNYIVANGRVIPYTNLNKTVSRGTPGFQNKDVLRQNGINSASLPHLSVAQQKEFQQSLVTFTELKKTDPEKVIHVEMLISAANKDPEIQKKLDDIRKFVHDYVAKQSPADLKTLEIMTKPKQILEHNGVPGNLVY